MKHLSVFVVVSSNVLTATLLLLFNYMFLDCSTASHKIPRDSEQPISLDSSSHHNSLSSSPSLLDSNVPIGTLDIADDRKHSSNIVLSKCSIPQKSKDGCTFVQFEALVNLIDKSVCKCAESRVTTDNQCVQKHKKTAATVEEKASSNLPIQFVHSDDPVYDDVSIFAITPTYARLTQKVDLTSLCYNIQNIPNFIWIVIEDSKTKTGMVTKVLDRCPVKTIHLNVKTSTVYKVLRSRGVEQRNLGLAWVRDYCDDLSDKPECSRGVMYFMDDDNKYDIRLFQEMKKTESVSVFPVGFAGGLKYEGPLCQNGTAYKWHAHYALERVFPMDMAGFAIHITHFLSKPYVKMGFMKVKGRQRPVKPGYLETTYLENFASKESVECRSPENEILVWHVKTLKPPLPYESKHAAKHKSDPHLEV